MKRMLFSRKLGVEVLIFVWDWSKIQPLLNFYLGIHAYLDIGDSLGILKD